MHRSSHKIRITIVITLILLIGGYSLSNRFGAIADQFYDELVNIVGIYGVPHILSNFDRTGSGGNAGRVIFIEESDESSLGGSGLYLDTSTVPQTLTGYVFLETVGWAIAINAQVIPPQNMNVMEPWALSGYLWSDSGGYIELQSDGSYSGAGYIPGTKSLTGYAWSDHLGYLRLSQVSGNSSFKNKVKVLGNIGGSKSLDTEYGIGVKFQSISKTDAINSIRKNVSIITRSFPNSYINTDNLTTKNYDGIMYYNSGGILVTGIASKILNYSLRSLIVIGGDIYIDQDIEGPIPAGGPRAIISLRNKDGLGGNIFIKSSVRNIYASLIAEGSIFSGDSANIYNDSIEELSMLPDDQLYIYGTIISNNTIGGSAQRPSPICPHTELSCNYMNSYKYDLNYFRSYNTNNSGSYRSDKSGFDDYSLIIESDPRLISNPPPGIETKK